MSGRKTPVTYGCIVNDKLIRCTWSFECFSVAIFQYFLDIRTSVQDFSTELDVRYPSLIPVILQASTADFQFLGQFPVCVKALSVQCSLSVGKEFLH